MAINDLSLDFDFRFYFFRSSDIRNGNQEVPHPLPLTPTGKLPL